VAKLKAELEAEGELARLREEKHTEPRMWFAVDDAHPMVAWADKVPHEGQSYHPDAYSVYEWREPSPPHARVAHPVDVQRSALGSESHEGGR
jgi:hypothetical protein